MELLGPVVQEDKEIAPFTDGRLVLNWEIIEKQGGTWVKIIAFV